MAPRKKAPAIGKAKKANEEPQAEKAMPKKKVDDDMEEDNGEKPAAGKSRGKAAPKKANVRGRKQMADDNESDAKSQSDQENEEKSSDEQKTDEDMEEVDDEKPAARTARANGASKKDLRGQKQMTDNSGSDAKSQTESESEDEEETMPTKAIDDKKPAARNTRTKAAPKSANSRGPKAMGRNKEPESDGDDSDGSKENEPMPKKPQPKATAKKVNIVKPIPKAKSKKKQSDEDEDEPVPKKVQKKDQDADESKESNDANSGQKITIAKMVNNAARYLVGLNGHSSLDNLKKYLVSEHGDVYVTRHYDRIKKELKEMFKRNEIHPAHRSKSGKPPSVSVQFKLRGTAKKRISSVHLKMVQKKAKALKQKGTKAAKTKETK